MENYPLLEMRLGPPGEHQPPLFSGYFNSSVHGAKRGLAGKAEDLSYSLPCDSKVAAQQCLDNKSCSSLCISSVSAQTSMINGSNKSCSLNTNRSEVALVVGWPSVGSFRKNLANSGFSKPASKLINEILEGSDKKSQSSKNSLFVKINMEGIPIGRKINLSAYNSYEQLSFAIDELFKAILAAQRGPPAPGTKTRQKRIGIIHKFRS